MINNTQNFNVKHTTRKKTCHIFQRLEEALESPWVQGAMKELLLSVPSPVSSLDLSSLPSIPSLMANLKQATPQLLESSQLVRVSAQGVRADWSARSGDLCLNMFTAVQHGPAVDSVMLYYPFLRYDLPVGHNLIFIYILVLNNINEICLKVIY